MTQHSCDYKVRCKSCFNKFSVQMYDSHEKCLWLVDNKDWYCDSCKKEYFDKKTATLSKASTSLGFPQLIGTPKRIAWAEKIRAELISKVNYLNLSLSHKDEDAKELSDKAFLLFFQEWQKETDAKWWIDNRTTNVRDISIQIKEITDTLS
ncbi:MAG: hypothetical protein HOJ48_00735 [Desulfobacula sp.]|jgi:hypothetical protein|nr:hypothetical protein [Desulfobacula sp.]